jgi:alkylation response protein AidB-like acyl-CoA dehydrogenase
VSPIHTVGGVRTNVTYYKDVRVPASMLVGELNRGWQLITEQLNHERVGLAALAYGAQGCFDDTLQWARSTRLRAARASSSMQPWVQMALAEAYVLLQAYAVLGNRVAWEVAAGRDARPARQRLQGVQHRELHLACCGCSWTSPAPPVS